MAPTNIPDLEEKGTPILQQLSTDNPTFPPIYFVSFFDPTRSIPFYSAYKVTPEQAALIGTKGSKSSGSKRNWRIASSKFCE